MTDRAARVALVTGWVLLALFLPLGLTLEALNALKVRVYLGSAMRREMWTLAHAHGNLLGLLCLVFAALGERVSSDPRRRLRIARILVAGAVLMPTGFLLAGVLNAEGDPSLAILLVPAGGVLLLGALASAALAARR